MTNNKKNTISKGYRLRPSTHRLIKQVQRTLHATQDKIISMAVKLFRKETEKSGKTKFTK
jgi:hypothetical protein